MIFYRQFFKNTTVFSLFCIVLYACSSNYQKIENFQEISCDAETTTIKNKQTVFINNGYYFESGENQRKAHSENFHVKSGKNVSFNV